MNQNTPAFGARPVEELVLGLGFACLKEPVGSKLHLLDTVIGTGVMWCQSAEVEEV